MNSGTEVMQTNHITDVVCTKYGDDQECTIMSMMKAYNILRLPFAMRFFLVLSLSAVLLVFGGGLFNRRWKSIRYWCIGETEMSEPSWLID